MTNARATAAHRRLDAEQAEAMARDGDELVPHAGALMAPQQRRQDMRTMMSRANGQRVPLVPLSQRVSGSGTTYLSGWMGMARLVAFAGEPDKYGNPTWVVYAAAPEPKDEQRRPAP